MAEPESCALDTTNGCGTAKNCEPEILGVMALRQVERGSKERDAKEDEGKKHFDGGVGIPLFAGGAGKTVGDFWLRSDFNFREETTADGDPGAGPGANSEYALTRSIGRRECCLNG